MIYFDSSFFTGFFHSNYFRPTVQWIFVIVFFLLAKTRRKKVRVLPSILISASIIFFALLSPGGHILYKIGNFRITENALVAGLNRSSILVGLVFLSQTIVSLKLHLPGKIGNFVNEMFSYFDKLTSVRLTFKNFKFGKIIESLDNRLLAIWNGEIGV